MSETVTQVSETEDVYKRQSVHSNVHNCPPLVDNRTGEPMKRGERRCF